MQAGIYLRQSVDKTGEELAVTRQREDCLRLCEQRGWTPVEYVDNDTSASSRKPRPAYERMMVDIRSGQVGAVVAWDADRLHRKPRELEDLLDIAEQRHIELATIGGDYDLSTDAGRYHARLEAARSRREIERKSARQKRAMLQLAEAGKPCRTSRAFGYTKDWTGLDKCEAAAVRDGYTMILSGGSLYSVAQQWNRAGIATSTGKTWTGRTVRQALLNPRYAALRSYRGKIMEGVKATWPAIVSEDVWRSVHDILTDQNRTPGVTARKHLLSGIALCGKCDAPLGSGVKRRGDGSVYVCKKCHKVSRATDLIDPPVIGLALAFLASPEAAELLINRKRADIAQLRQEERALLKKLDKVAEDYDNELLTGRQAKIVTDRNEARLAEVRAKMRDANKAKIFDGLIGAKNVRRVWNRFSLERKRAVLATLFEVKIKPVGSGRRTFDADEHIGIRWLTGEE